MAWITQGPLIRRRSQEIKTHIKVINSGIFGAEVHKEDGDERERVGAEKNGTWTPERKTEDRGRRKEAAFPDWIRRKKTMLELLKKHLRLNKGTPNNDKRGECNQRLMPIAAKIKTI